MKYLILLISILITQNIHSQASPFYTDYIPKSEIFKANTQTPLEPLNDNEIKSLILICEAEILFHQKNYLSALNKFLEAQSNGFSDCLLFYQIGLCYLRTSSHLKAVEFFSKSYHHFKMFEYADNIFYRKRCFNKEDIDYYIIEHQVYKNAQFCDILENSALALYSLNLFELAYNQAKQACEYKWASSNAYLYLGMSCAAMDEHIEAIENFTKSLAIEQQITTYFFRATSYVKIFQYDKACMDFRKARNMGFTDAQQFVDLYCY
jgi:tetratricopeptide (TPR) repeat protein